jgi:hypothetical protein
MKSYNFENMVINISNGWIVGCSILSCGMMSYAYLDAIGKLPLIHMKRKYHLELSKTEKSTDNDNVNEKIKNEEKLISYYFHYFNFAFIIGIAGITLPLFKFILKRKN